MRNLIFDGLNPTKTESGLYGAILGVYGDLGFLRFVLDSIPKITQFLS